MSNEITLSPIQFKRGTQAKFDTLIDLNLNSLYFTTDTGRLYDSNRNLIGRNLDKLSVGTSNILLDDNSIVIGNSSQAGKYGWKVIKSVEDSNGFTILYCEFDSSDNLTNYKFPTLNTEIPICLRVNGGSNYCWIGTIVRGNTSLGTSGLLELGISNCPIKTKDSMTAYLWFPGEYDGNTLLDFTYSKIAMGYACQADSLGSTALGYGAIASGRGAFSAGRNTLAGHYASVALNQGTKALGDSSIACNSYNISQGPNSSSFGFKTISSGDASFSTGRETSAEGKVAIAFGEYTHAIGSHSIAAGVSSSAFSSSSFVFGEGLTASRSHQFVVGKNNKESDALFVVGIGDGNPNDGSTDKLNGLEVYSDGSIWIPSILYLGGTKESPKSILKYSDKATACYTTNGSAITYNGWYAYSKYPAHTLVQRDGNGCINTTTPDGSYGNAVTTVEYLNNQIPQIKTITDEDLIVEQALCPLPSEGTIGYIQNPFFNQHFSDVIDPEDHSFVYDQCINGIIPIFSSSTIDLIIKTNTSLYEDIYKNVSVTDVSPYWYKLICNIGEGSEGTYKELQLSAKVIGKYIIISDIPQEYSGGYFRINFAAGSYTLIYSADNSTDESFQGVNYYWINKSSNLTSELTNMTDTRLYIDSAAVLSYSVNYNSMLQFTLPDLELEDKGEIYFMYEPSTSDSLSNFNFNHKAGTIQLKNVINCYLSFMWNGIRWIGTNLYTNELLT